jgi:hypothetical protein
MSLLEDNSREGLIDIANKVHDVGYESLLLVYDSFLDNVVVNVANTINPKHTFKYIIAIRTYSVSPEYLAQVYETFEKIAPGRVTFNIIPGNIKPYETSINDVVFIEDKIDTKEKLNDYTLEWLKKYKKLSVRKKLPPLMLSGQTIDFQKYSIENGIINIIKVNDFLNQYGSTLLNNKNQIVSTPISGDNDSVKSLILDLESKGVSDVLVYYTQDNKNASEIHNIIKSLFPESLHRSKEMIE